MKVASTFDPEARVRVSEVYVWADCGRLGNPASQGTAIKLSESDFLVQN